LINYLIVYVCLHWEYMIEFFVFTFPPFWCTCEHIGSYPAFRVRTVTLLTTIRLNILLFQAFINWSINTRFSENMKAHNNSLLRAVVSVYNYIHFAAFLAVTRHSGKSWMVQSNCGRTGRSWRLKMLASLPCLELNYTHGSASVRLWVEVSLSLATILEKRLYKFRWNILGFVFRFVVIEEFKFMASLFTCGIYSPMKFFWAEGRRGQTLSSSIIWGILHSSFVLSMKEAQCVDLHSSVPNQFPVSATSKDVVITGYLSPRLLKI